MPSRLHSSQPDMPPRAPLHPATLPTPPTTPELHLPTPPITTGPALHRSVRHAYPACPAPRQVATARSDDPSHSLPVHPDHSPRPGYVTPPPKSTGLSVPSASLPCPTTLPSASPTCPSPPPITSPALPIPARLPSPRPSANSPTPTTLPSAIRMRAHPDYPPRCTAERPQPAYPAHRSSSPYPP